MHDTHVDAVRDNKEIALEVAKKLPSFHELNTVLRQRAERLIAENNSRLFMVDLQWETGTTHPLIAAFLNAFSDTEGRHPEMSDRKWHTCNTCLHFIRQIGGLVVINPTNGETKSVYWDEEIVDPFYQPAIKALRELVEKKPISHVFLSAHAEFGASEAGGFNHFYLLNVFQADKKAASAIYGASREAFKSLKSNIENADTAALRLAVGYFLNDARLAGYDRFRENTVWFKELKDQFDATKHELHKDNIIWMQSAIQSEGRIHFPTKVPGQFVEALKGGVAAAEDAIAIMISQASPERYLRPVEAPTEGNIAAAEKLIADMGLEKSLERRQARMEDIPLWVWQPASSQIAAADEPVKTGIFSHLETKERKIEKVASELPVFNGGVKTWDFFEREILPKATALHVILTDNVHQFGGLATAVHPDAPPIIRWDKADRRNPFSHYVRSEARGVMGTRPRTWGLPTYREIEVLGITYMGEEFTDEKARANSRQRFMALAEGTISEPPTLALFPELLIPELFPIRSTIEAFSNKGQMPEDPQAKVWLALQSNMTFVVTTPEGRTRYVIDRFI